MIRRCNSGDWTKSSYVKSQVAPKNVGKGEVCSSDPDAKQVWQYFVTNKKKTDFTPSKPKKPEPKPETPKPTEKKPEPEKPKPKPAPAVVDIDCESGFEATESGVCGIICEDYFYRGSDLKTCKQKSCTGLMTVHKSGRFCERTGTTQFEYQDEVVDYLKGQIVSNEKCEGHMLKGKKLDDFGEKINTELNKKTVCRNDYKVKIVSYTTTPEDGFRFVWVDELQHDDKFKLKFSSIQRYGTVIALVNGSMSSNK